MSTRLPFVGGALAALVLLCSTPAAGQYGRISSDPLNGGWRTEVTGGVSTTQISGDAASGEARSAPNGRILARIQAGEMGDRPCTFELSFHAFDLDPDGDASVRAGTNTTARIGTSCRAPDRSVALGTGSVITGLRVCQRRQNGRVKGIALRGRTVSAGGRGPVYTRSFERTNCNEWSRWVDCPGDQVATGVVAHWRDASIVGAALQCRSLQLTAVRPARTTALRQGAPALELTGSSAGTGTSGTNGVTQRLRAPDGMALKSIQFGERNDRPCYLQAVFTTYDGSFSSGSRTFDRCNGSRGDLRTVEIATSPSALQWASGIQVCQRRQNDRLKGIRLSGSRVDAQGTHHDPAIQAVQERPNCNQWAQQAFCTQGSVITEVEVHYRTTGNRPAEITGLAVTCAQAAVR